MKKLYILCIAAFLLTMAAPLTVQAARTFVVYIDDVLVDFGDHPPIQPGHVVLFPVRPIFEQLGFTVTWLGERQAAHLVRGELEIKLQVSNPITYVAGGRTRHSFTTPIIENGRVFACIRHLFIDLNTTEWRENVGTTHITTLTTLIPFGGPNYAGMWRSLYWLFYDDDSNQIQYFVTRSNRTAYFYFQEDGLLVNYNENRENVGRDGRRSAAWTVRLDENGRMLLQPLRETSVWVFERINDWRE